MKQQQQQQQQQGGGGGGRSIMSLSGLTGMRCNLIILATVLLFACYYMYLLLGGNPFIGILCIQCGGDPAIPFSRKFFSNNKTQSCTRHGELCAMNSAEVSKILSVPHDCHSGGRRFWFNDDWKSLTELSPLVDALKEKNVNHTCVVGCFSNEVPCLDEQCLLQFYLRPGASDILVLEQLYEKTEYSFVGEYNLTNILDAGGNIGLAAMMFANLFPNATIITLEPASKNYETLLMNVRPYPNVRPLHAALWDTLARVGVTDPGLGNEWGTMVAASASGVPATTVDYVADLFNLERFDFTKIDIEGAEKEVFTVSETNHMSWLRKVPLVMVEMHDWMKPGSTEAVMRVFDNGLIKEGEGEKEMEYRQIRDYGMWKAWENTALASSIRRKQPPPPTFN